MPGFISICLHSESIIRRSNNFTSNCNVLHSCNSNCIHGNTIDHESNNITINCPLNIHKIRSKSSVESRFMSGPSKTNISAFKVANRHTINYQSVFANAHTGWKWWTIKTQMSNRKKRTYSHSISWYSYIRGIIKGKVQQKNMEKKGKCELYYSVRFLSTEHTGCFKKPKTRRRS